VNEEVSQDMTGEADRRVMDAVSGDDNKWMRR